MPHPITISSRTPESSGLPLASPTNPSRVGRLFEHFLVVGFPRDTLIEFDEDGDDLSLKDAKVEQAEILFQYPRAIPLSNDQVALIPSIKTT